MDRAIDKRMYSLYHSEKNINALPTALLLGFLAIFLKDVIICEIIIWGYYIVYCRVNNKLLDNDPRIRALRMYYIIEYDKLKDENEIGLRNCELMGLYKKYM